MPHQDVGSPEREKGLRDLHGRTLQGKNEVYLLPADSPEMERLTRQHRMVTLSQNTLCWPEKDVRGALAHKEGSTLRVIDLGSGSGVWVAEMAREYPHCEILGVDLTPMKPSDAPVNARWILSIMAISSIPDITTGIGLYYRYECLDVVNGDISHLQSSFDLVHCRAMDLGVREFKPFTCKIVSLVKPGGLIVIITGDLGMYDENREVIRRAQIGHDTGGGGSWLSRITGEYQDRVHQWAEYPPSIGFSIPEWLATDSRLVDVKTSKLYLPVGWPDTSQPDLYHSEEVARLMCMNSIDIGKAFRPALIEAGVAAEEVDTWLKENERDAKGQRVRVSFLLHFCAARVGR